MYFLFFEMMLILDELLLLLFFPMATFDEHTVINPLMALKKVF